MVGGGTIKGSAERDSCRLDWPISRAGNNQNRTKTRQKCSPDVAEKEPIVRRCLEWMCKQYSMLITAIPDVEILAFRLMFTVSFNAFARWHQSVRFKRWGV